MDNHDVLTEILFRLLAKSLIRFKSVCKKWLSLVSSDYFCRQHTLRSPKLQQSLILQYFGNGRDPDFFYYNPTSTNGDNVMIPYTLSRNDFTCGHHYKILHACNGLWLLRGLDPDSCVYQYHVYNPTTRRSTKINNRTENEIMALAYDPLESPHYKIVCLIGFPINRFNSYQVEVYDSESRSWKPNLGPVTLPHGFGSYEAQYYNNAIFWWCSPYGTHYYCFDIAKNEMKPFPFPQSLSQGSNIQELDGNLYCLTSSFGRSHQLLVEVWELVVGGDGNSPPEWVSKHHSSFIAREGLGESIRLMGDSDENLMVLVYYRLSVKMKAYNFLNKSGEDLTAPSFGHKYGHCVDISQFGETLALV